MMEPSRRKSRRNRALSPVGTPRIDDVTSSQTTEQPMVFKLPLKPIEDSESFKPSVQLVSREYATRYLESVGVRPTRAAIDMVARNAPLTEGNIKTTLRAKGHVEDTIQIHVPPVLHHYRPPVVINPAAVLQLGIGNTVMGAGTGASAEAAEAESDGVASPTAAGRAPGSRDQPGGRGRDGGTTASRPPGGNDFLDLAARYLHPFKLDLDLARQNLTSLYSAARLSRGASPGEGPGGGGGGDSRAGVAGSSSVGASTSGREWSNGGGTGGGEARWSIGGGAGARGGPGALGAGGTRSWNRSSSGEWTGPGQRPRPGQGQQPSDSGGAEREGGGEGRGARGGPTLDAVRLEVLEELSQPLLVTPEVVLTLQGQLEAALVDWHRNQAPEALKGRLTPEEFRRTREELSAEGTLKLLITLANFLHEELVRGHPDFPAHLQLDGRQTSRDGRRSSQGRVRDSIVGDRLSGHGAGGDGGASSARSHQSLSNVRGWQQLPNSISTQQMTALQKYDLGYQAYVRQKLDQRQVHTNGEGSACGGSREGPLGGRAVGGPRGYGLASAAGDRPQQTSSPQQQPSRQQMQSQQMQSQQMQSQQMQSQQMQSQQGDPQQQGGPETQRVSFAVAPQYPSLARTSSPPGVVRVPESPVQGRGASVSLWGALNLPGAPRSRPSSEHNLRTTSPSTASVDCAPGATSPIPGLPPRVGRALRHSPSFALASAATTARSIHASLDAEDVAALQRERLYALHVAFAARYKVLRQTRSGMFFTLPILLLSMRLCVNLLFNALFPLWTRLPEGATLLEDMDAAICALFDPHGYLERALSVLQSTPTAIEAVTRHPQRRGNERQHFNDTSALMQASLRGPKSAGARKLMQAGAKPPPGRGLLRTQLTNEQRAALFQQGLQWMQQQDPVLSQVGEPHPAGRPLSF